MSVDENESSSSNEHGKEHQIMFMNPASSVVDPTRNFFPYGCTPPENLLGSVPKDARRADVLLLGCSDARHVLFTLWKYASECNRERGRREEEGVAMKSKRRFEGLQTLRFTLNDREPACLARVLLLVQLFLDTHGQLIDACAQDASPEKQGAYFDRIALCFSAYYNVYVDKVTQAAVQNAAIALLDASASPDAWARSRVGAITHVAGIDTLDRLRAMWFMYADTSIAILKPKSSLDKERRLHHERTVPNKNLSERILHGEGPGVAAYLSLGWGAEMTGIHHQYHIWGYVDPFRELQESLNVDIRQRLYTNTNPAMIATNHQELEFQLHHSCNPFAAFHLDTVWVDFKGSPQPCPGSNRINRPFYGGPPVMPGSSSAVPSRRAFKDSQVEATKFLRSKLVSVALEQLSRMCWGVNWAFLEARNAGAPSQSWCPVVDVRLNVIVGDALDTCDAICSLASEGLAAAGLPDDVEEPSRVCGLMPSMSLRPFVLERRNLGGPGRFDFIDSADLSDRLGVLNVVMAASPLLKPSLHAILRTDLRRSGASRKREFAARDDVENVSDPPVKEEDDSYLCVTEDDWCTSLVHECATLLGVIPVGAIVPVIGHTHNMLESARLAKTNQKNSVGDLGQRMRIAWKQACLVDRRAGAYIGWRGRTPLTLHPRLCISPENFSAMVIPFWMFMARSLFFESGDCTKVREGDDQQLRISPYTAASFARLICHSLRFLKLDRPHVLKVVEDLNARYSEGLFSADVVAQLDLQLHMLGLYKHEVMSAPDVVRWTRQCPWWEKKPAADSTAVVPAGSPGICRVVMIAPSEAVKKLRQLRDPALCVVLEDVSQKFRMMTSTLHCCFVRAHRASGSFPPIENEGKPWYFVRESLLRVRETRADDPGAELMVSFLLASKFLVSASSPNEIKLELRLQDSAAARHVAQLHKLPSKSEGVIFRTNLNERGETAVIFPSKKPSATILERWAPQSVEWETLLQDDKGTEPGLRPRRVGKSDRYVVTPSRPELVLAETVDDRYHELKAGWVKKMSINRPDEKPPCLLFTLQMSNPAARALLSDEQQTKVFINTVPPCSVEIVLGAPEKNSHGLIRSNSAKGGSKKKRKGGTDDLSKGGIDGGLRYLMVLPFPIASVEATGRDSAGLQMTALLQKHVFSHPFVNVVQTVDEEGRKIFPPLISNWSFPVRSTSDDRRLVENNRSAWLVDKLTLVPGDHPVDPLSNILYSISAQHMHTRQEDDGEALEEGEWCVIARDGDEGAYFLALHVVSVLVDESNESLLLDAVVSPESVELDGLVDFLDETTRPHRIQYKNVTDDAAVAWRSLLPMAVERGRRTYSHQPDCRYLSFHSAEALTSGRLLCGCGAGKDIPPSVSSMVMMAERPRWLVNALYRAVLPLSLFPVPSVRPKSRDGHTHVVECPSHEVPPLLAPWSKLSYAGPIKGRGDIFEAISGGAVRDGNAAYDRSGASNANADGRDANGNNHSQDLDMETAENLAKAGLREMPQTSSSHEWVSEGLPPDEACGYCREAKAPKRCSRCKNIRYCSRQCQSEHWPTHKKSCYGHVAH